MSLFYASQTVSLQGKLKLLRQIPVRMKWVDHVTDGEGLRKYQETNPFQGHFRQMSYYSVSSNRTEAKRGNKIYFIVWPLRTASVSVY